jgi:coenzyme Q-binding protein COQ10
MFQLVADLETYPEFLPGWKHVAIKDRKKNVLMAEQEIGYSKFQWKFMSKAELHKPKHVKITSTEEPFKHLLIDWHLKSKGDNRTEVEFTIEMKMRSMILDGLMKRAIEKPVKELLTVFEQRAHEVYGK